MQYLAKCFLDVPIHLLPKPSVALFKVCGHVSIVHERLVLQLFDRSTEVYTRLWCILR